MSKKFSLWLLLSIFCTTPLMAMIPEDREPSAPLIRKWHPIDLLGDDTQIKKTTKKDYYMFGTLGLGLGLCICQESVAPGFATMVLGGFLCYQGYIAPARDHFN